MLRVPRSPTHGERVSPANMARARSSRFSARSHSPTTRPSRERMNVTPGSPSAAASTTSVTRADSVAVDLRNLRRAGTLKNSSRTSTTVPAAPPAGETVASRPPSTVTRVPSASPLFLVRSSSRLTEAMLGSASPRKPNEWMLTRSSSEPILLVAWRRTAIRASSRSIPAPSSATRTSSMPPVSMSTRMRRPPASSAFSSSSLTTLAGRSTTSPAAIWLARSSGRRRMVVTALRCSGWPGPRPRSRSWCGRG